MLTVAESQCGAKPIPLTDLQRTSSAHRLATEIVAEVRVAHLGACWIWQGAKFKNGYGKMMPHGAAGRQVKAHRLALVMASGDSDLEACHHCDQPDCVRPDHLFWGTHGENMGDCKKKGRSGMLANPGRAARGEMHGMRKHPERAPAGERNGNAKLTNEQAAAIRARYRAGGVTQRQLGAEFGIHQKNVSRIIRSVGYAG